MTHQDPTRFAASPKSLGFHMPAEYAPHKRSWMMWPSRAEVWPDMAATKRDYAAVAQAIAEFEPMCMAVQPEDAAEARAMLGSAIELFEVGSIISAHHDRWIDIKGETVLGQAER